MIKDKEDEMMNKPNVSNLEKETFDYHNDYYQYTHFQNEMIMNLNQHNIEYKNCIFENTSMIESSIENSFFVDVIFKNCDLSNSVFRSCLFRRVHFMNCKLMGSDFSDSLFDDVFLQDCLCSFINLSYMKNKAVSFQGCDLRNGSIIEVNQKKTTYKECCFYQCEVLHSSFYNIDLSTCDLQQIITTPHDIKGAIINEYQSSSLIHLLDIKVK